MDQKDYVVVNIPSSCNTSYNTSYSPNSIYRLPSSPTSPISPPSPTSPVSPLSPLSPPSPTNIVPYNLYSSQIYIPSYDNKTCRRRNRQKPLCNRAILIQPDKTIGNQENNPEDVYINIGNYENYENNYLQDVSASHNDKKITLTRRFTNYIGFKISNYDNEDYLNV